MHTLKHVLEMPLQLDDILAVSNDIEEIFVADEVETRKGFAFSLQVLGQRLGRHVERTHPEYLLDLD